MADLSKFKAPYIPKAKVQAEADQFRRQYWRDKPLPVDIHSVIEFDLDMDVRTVPSLREAADVDALLLGDMSTIVVDRDMYMDDRMLSRMRYSLAHEVAHKVLHPEVYAKIGHETVEDWIQSYQSMPDDEYSWIEQHAYEFAGRLLVPPDVLKAEYEAKVTIAKAAGFDQWDKTGQAALEYIAHAISVSGPFGVSDQVIARRLKIEAIWNS